MGGAALTVLSLGLLVLAAHSVAREHTVVRRGEQTVLVLLEDMGLRESHSRFFQQLAASRTLEFKLASDPSVALSDFDVYLYDALIIFGSKISDFGGEVDVAAILEFIDSGHDVILATDVRATSALRELATECGVDFDDGKTFVVDRSSVTNTGDETIIAASLTSQQAQMLGLSAKKVQPRNAPLHHH
eukprot:7128009-Pyramimonas_sp.AAC.1